MFAPLLTAKAKKLSSALTKVDFFFPGTFSICMIFATCCQIALTSP